MTVTPNLGLPELVASQAQKHVTHNEALRALDALMHLAVLDRDLATPPSSPDEGERWIVAASATGDWAGRSGNIAAWQDSGWQFYEPQTGWLAYVVDEGALLAWTGTAWVDAISAITSLNNMTLLGVGTAADAANPFSAKLNNILWTARTAAEGGDGDLRWKMSKESAADTLSMLFQTGFSGRAEIGLIGDDNFHIKVSPDGSAWINALSVERATGAAKIHGALALTGDISPAELTVDQNNYNPAGLAGAAVLRLSSDASRTLTGLAGGSDGRKLTLINIGANPIALAAESASSSGANRFAIAAGVNLLPSQSVSLWYDATSSRWRLLSATSTASYRLRQITTIFASTTYNVPPGVRALYVEAVGGGGGGGYATGAAGQAAAGGGGAGGSGARSWLTSLAASYAVTIGTGGAGGVAASSTDAVAGGTSSFGSNPVALGGGAGASDGALALAHVGGDGGGSTTAGSSGDQMLPGGAGTAGLTISQTSGIAGSGGMSAFGGGGGRGRSTMGVGSPAAANSGGGGAGALSASATNRNGGDGGSGYVRIWEFH